VRSLFACLCLAISFILTTAGARADRVHFDLPKGPGRDLVYGHCQTCHDLQSVVDSAGIRRGAWDAVLDNMYGFGLRVTDDQRAKILDYLATYLGPNPPPEDTTDETPTDVSGLEVFNNTCIACHQEDGRGKPEEFPPLAGNHDLFLSRDFPAIVALNGFEGKFDVMGETYDKVMPSFDFLTDAELAAVLAYVRAGWGNDALRPAGMTDLSADDIAALRATPMSTAEVYALRQSLLPK
jgi:mono/diheme cytochrome c family protein